jgi:Domain of unknown function (DUF4293)
MIQRKQTLFLLAAALLCGLSFLFPIAHYDPAGAAPSYDLFTTGVIDRGDGDPVQDFDLKYPVHLLYALMGLALVVDIFLFKNRKRQLTVLRSVYVFGGLLIVLQLVTDQGAYAYISQGAHWEHGYGPTMFFPLGILLFMYLAQRGIQKDEELVRSMDRLR